MRVTLDLAPALWALVDLVALWFLLAACAPRVAPGPLQQDTPHLKHVPRVPEEHDPRAIQRA